MGRVVNFSIVFVALVFLVLVLQTLQSFLRPFIVAIVLTLLIMPLLRKFEKKGVPFMVTFVGVIIVLSLLITIGISLLSQNIQGLNEAVPAQQEKMQALAHNLDNYLSQFSVGGNQLSLKQLLEPEKVGAFIGSSVSSLLNGARLVVTEVFLVILFMIFIIPSYKTILRDVLTNFGEAKSGRVREVLFQIEKSIKDYLVTKTLISFGTAFISAVILFFFKSELVVFLALLIFLLNFIPNIGSFIAVLVAIAVYFVSFGVGVNLVLLAVLLIGVQIVFGNIVEPKVAGNKLKLSPVVILLGLFFWGWTWGIVGMFLAVPLTSIIKIILENVESTKTIAKFMS